MEREIFGVYSSDNQYLKVLDAASKNLNERLTNYAVPNHPVYDEDGFLQLIYNQARVVGSLARLYYDHDRNGYERIARHAAARMKIIMKRFGGAR